MSIRTFTTTSSEGKPSFITNLTPDQVILDNYFYFTEVNFFENHNLYSDDQLHVILNLTDREYCDVIQSIHAANQGETSQELEAITAKIAELETQLSISRKIEESQKTKTKIQEDLGDISKKLESVSDIQDKYETLVTEQNQVNHLTGYNLDKIHEDLVSLMNRAGELEDKILNFKSNEIQHSVHTSKTYDKGRIGLAIGLMIAFILIDALLYIALQTDAVINIALAAFVIVTGSLFIYTSKIEFDHPIYQDEEQPEDLDSLKEQLAQIKHERERILRLVQVRDSDEFFNTKAKLKSYTKSLTYLQESRDKLLEGEDYESIISQKEQLETQIRDIDTYLHDNPTPLSPEQYLNIRREVDYLKLDLQKKQQNSKLNATELTQKLFAIRKELQDKLPEFCSIIRENFTRYYTQIHEFVDKYAQRAGRHPLTPDPDGKNYENMSRMDKVIIQFALTSFIYNNELVFGISGTTTWSAAEHNDLEIISEITADQKCDIVLVD